MNFNNDTGAIAEMFTDMADMFCESVDHDSIHMLLIYSLDASGLQHGKIVLDSFGTENALHTSISAPFEYIEKDSEFLPQRARSTLHTEFSVTGEPGQLRCEYAFPMRVRGICLGVISLYSSSQPPLSEHSIIVLQSIADIAATTIDQTHRINQAYLLVGQLQNALDSRVLIEQAKGVIAERNKVDFTKAFHEIRMLARQEQRPVRAVAAEIVAQHHCLCTGSTSLRQ
jgi:GAF domain-containing protein